MDQRERLVGAYEDGLEHLKNAKSASSDNTRKSELITAADCFLTASTMDHPPTAAQANFFAGVCYELLGEKDTALVLFREAYEGYRYGTCYQPQSNPSLRLVTRSVAIPLLKQTIWSADRASMKGTDHDEPSSEPHTCDYLGRSNRGSSPGKNDQWPSLSQSPSIW